MADLVDYEVAREHLGDEITADGIKARMFQTGDTRTADPVTVASLVRSGVLIDPNAAGAKADGPALDKAERRSATKAA